MEREANRIYSPLVTSGLIIGGDFHRLVARAHAVSRRVDGDVKRAELVVDGMG